MNGTSARLLVRRTFWSSGVEKPLRTSVTLAYTAARYGDIASLSSSAAAVTSSRSLRWAAAGCGPPRSAE